jgi:hypothetical protein
LGNGRAARRSTSTTNRQVLQSQEIISMTTENNIQEHRLKPFSAAQNAKNTVLKYRGIKQDSEKEKRRLQEVEDSKLVKSIRRGISNLVAIEHFEKFDMIVQQYFYSKSE